MAHTCPVCGAYCNCNGDIDDVCLDFEDDVLACVHCDDDCDFEAWELDDEDPYYDDCDGGNNIEGGCGMCPYDSCVYLDTAKKKIRFGFKSRNQQAWFMVWREYWQNGQLVHAEVLFRIG